MDDTGPYHGPRRRCSRPFRRVPVAAFAMIALVAGSGLAQDLVPQDLPPELAPVEDGVASSQTLEQPLVDVQVEGNRTIPISAIRQHIKCKPGRAVSSGLISADTQALIKTRWFITVEPRVEYTSAGQVLIFRVVERPIVRKIEYRGAEKKNVKHLAALTGLKADFSPYDPHTNIEAARRIEDWYREKGYFFAKVTLVSGDKPEDREVIFDIVEGHKVRVFDVKFHGNEQWFNSTGYLKTKLQTERMFPIVPGWLALPFGAFYKPETIPNDVASLRKYYEGLGFFDVAIEHEVHFNEDKSRVTIDYYITEGTRYRVKDIRYEGNDVYSVEELSDGRELNPGEFFNERELAKDLTRMNELYGSLGRLYASVVPNPQFTETPGETVLVFRINEDRPYYIRNVDIAIRGDHPHTKVTVPLNMSRIHPGDLADPKLIKKSQQRIEGSGIFERGLGEGVKVDIQRVGLEEEEDPTFRGQSDDGTDPWFNPPTTSYRPENPFIAQTSAELPTSNPFDAGAAAQSAPMVAQAAPPVGTVPAIDRPVRQPAATRTSFAPTTNSTVEPPVFEDSPLLGQPPVQTAQANVNPYGGAGQIQPLAGQAGDYTPPWVPSSPMGDPFADYPNSQAPGFVDLNISATEARTGRLMVGAGVNSNSGVVGNIVFSEDNFDILRFPRSTADIWNGTAWRGAGQRFRIEAVPGNVVSRYLVSWTDPFFLDTDYSLGLSGFYFKRFYSDWNEERGGGRVNVGRQLTQNLSASAILRAENVDISNPTVPTPQILQDALGSSMLLTAGGALTWDNRDSPLLPSEGQFAELTYTQGIHDYQYPRVDLEATQYFTVFSRPDGTGKHIFSVGGQLGWTGDDTPIFERYFAGGFQSLRGFEFRGVGPREFGVNVGGQFLVAGTLQYMFPLLANDALHGVVFSDFGTVNEDVSLDDFRTSIGTGLRIAIPAFGPAPLAFDFAFPITRADGDETQIFSFYIGLQR